MNIKSINVVKHPVDHVWTVMRDELPKLAGLLKDIDAITMESYEKTAPNVVKVVNLWKTSPNLPAIATKYFNTDAFTWTDRAEWDYKKLECTWSIEPHLFKNIIQCGGTTQFIPAMGGNGTRVVFTADIKLKNQNLIGVPAFLEGTVSKGIEAFVNVLIPKNFRKIMEAISIHLDSQKK